MVEMLLQMNLVLTTSDRKPTSTPVSSYFMPNGNNALFLLHKFIHRLA